MSDRAGLRPGLVRALGVSASAAMVICNVVGQGVFLKARAMTCNVGSPQLVLAAWVVAGALALCGALTLSELAAMIPQSGGPYAYLRRAFGEPTAFAYGWMSFFLGAPLAAAALAAGAAIFLNLITGGALSDLDIPIALGAIKGHLAGTQTAALFMLAAVTVVNLAPVRTNGAIATAFAVVKVAMLAALAIFAFAIGHGTWSHFQASGASGSCVGIASAARNGAAGFGAAMLGALYAYQGWTSLTYVAGEVRNPGWTLPRALNASMLLIIVLYGSANAAYFYILSPVHIASMSPASSVGIEALGQVFGPAARGIATLLLLVSVIATLHVSILTNTRITYALASDGVFLPWLSKVSARTHVPSRAVLVTSGVAAVLILLGTFDTLSDFQIFSVWIFYGLTAACVFVLRRREPNVERPYKVFGYPVMPALFVAATIWLIYEAVVANPVRSFIGLGIIALALPVYALVRSRQLRA